LPSLNLLAGSAPVNDAFNKTPDDVFARNLLATTTQKPGQTLDDYLQEHRRLSKDCNFRAVNKAERRGGIIPDAFINVTLSLLRQERA